MRQPLIAQYSPQDYTEVIQLWRRAGLILSLSDTRDEFRKFHQYNPDSFLLLKLDGRIIGSVLGSFDGRRGYIHHLAVDPDHQGRGYGQLLMKRVEQFFTDNNVVKIHLMVEKSNEKVVGYYESIGWHVRHDLILMSKTLREESFNI